MHRISLDTQENYDNGSSGEDDWGQGWERDFLLYTLPYSNFLKSWVCISFSKKEDNKNNTIHRLKKDVYICLQLYKYLYYNKQKKKLKLFIEYIQLCEKRKMFRRK